jgi:hypothetical protein
VTTSYPGPLATPKVRPRVTDVYASRIVGLLHGLASNSQEERFLALVPVLEDFLADRLDEMEAQLSELAVGNLATKSSPAGKFFKETSNG